MSNVFASMLAIITKMQPLFAPGSDWEYSNSNYYLLGLIVEQLSGKPFAQLLRQRHGAHSQLIVS